MVGRLIARARRVAECAQGGVERGAVGSARWVAVNARRYRGRRVPPWRSGPYGVPPACPLSPKAALLKAARPGASALRGQEGRAPAPSRRGAFAQAIKFCRPVQAAEKAPRMPSHRQTAKCSAAMPDRHARHACGVFRPSPSRLSCQRER